MAKVNQKEYMMEDNYRVDVALNLSSYGHHDEKFPDKNCSINFNATDIHMDVVLDQFRDFLILMGYVIDGRRLVLVDDDR